MRCISTFAVMGASDLELDTARRHLAAHLEKASPMAGPGTDPASLWASGSWAYRCSIPRRQDNGAILYVHVFQHAQVMTGGDYFSLGVAASPGWWPVGCESLVPRARTQGRAALRLVS
jgi:hypothetical protein